MKKYVILRSYANLENFENSCIGVFYAQKQFYTQLQLYIRILYFYTFIQINMYVYTKALLKGYTNTMRLMNPILWSSSSPTNKRS